MKKIISSVLVVILLISGLFIMTGCGNEENGNAKDKKDVVEISRVLGKGKFTISVPKKEDGTAKYEFTDQKPTEAKIGGTFYLVTDTAVFSFGTSGFAYQTAKAFKEKNGEQKGTFDGYLEWMKDPDSTIKLSGMEQFEINGRKALRYYCRTGGSGDYKYHGYNYLIGVDDIYTGSRAEMTVCYKDTNYPSEAKEFDEETLSIINSLKIEANK